jgi:hypothetical protein
MRNRATVVIGTAMLSMFVVSCADSPGGAPTGVRTVPRISAALEPSDPGGPNPLGEQIVVCKQGGGSGTFTVTGSGVNQAFALNSGQCWDVGFFGGAGVTVSITETPAAGFQVASISVNQLTGADQNVTGTNTVTGVVASGAPAQSAYVVFTNEEVERGAEGCTPGYWKQEQHFDSWVGTGYTPNTLFSSVFTVQANDGLPANLTLAQALDLGGGGANALARHAVAALLNAASGGVDYPYTTAEVIADVNAAFLANDYEGTKDDLAAANELGCPLD